MFIEKFLELTAKMLNHTDQVNTQQSTKLVAVSINENVYNHS